MEKYNIGQFDDDDDQNILFDQNMEPNLWLISFYRLIIICVKNKLAN